MNRVLVAVAAVLSVILLGGCAANTPQGMKTDPRVGTDMSPYRTIPAAIQCDGCGYDAAR